MNVQNDDEVDIELTKFNNQQRLDEWQHVALVLDRIFFLLFTIAMPCTALLFVSTHSSIGNSFRSNLTNTTLPKDDAKCDVLYTPALN
jgi:cytochrome b561